MLCRTFIRTVRLTAPSLSPVSPGLGEFTAASPFPDSRPAVSISPRISAPLLGFPTPKDRCFNPATDREAHLTDAFDCLSLPAAASIASFGCGSTFQARLASAWLAVPRTSWNQTLCSLKPASQSNKFLAIPAVFLSFVMDCFVTFTRQCHWILCG